MGNCNDRRNFGFHDEPKPKSFPDPEEDVGNFTHLHSWYKHEQLERKSLFYVVSMQGIQRGHPIQVDGKEGLKYHWHFVSSLDDFKTVVDSKILDICQKHPFYISCFLSGEANVTLSIRRANENKEYATRIKECKERIEKMNSSNQEFKDNTIIDFMSNHVENAARKHIEEKKDVVVPPDIFEYCEKYYPETFDIIKNMDRDVGWNRPLESALSPMIQKERKIQVEDAKTAAKKCLQGTCSNQDTFIVKRIDISE